uniref:Uncharacterized protein n=1 Tax=Plectus sambesii TaxID=2011161 RepID=A0A914X033_9BILA
MPESARNTLLAPVLQGLIDDQSVFYLIDDSNDGGQLAISVEDFKELASKHSNRPTGNCEELSVENIAQKAGELSSVPKHADNPSADHQPQITNEKTVPPNLMAAFRNIKVQPSMACNKAFKEIRPAPPHDKDGEEGEYVNCKRRFSRDVLLPFWRHRSKYSRCIIILAVLFLIGIVIAGALAPVFWPKETEPPATTVSPIIPTTSKYLPPEE